MYNIQSCPADRGRPEGTQMTDLFYSALHSALDAIAKPAPVKPVEVAQCYLCHGSGIYAQDTFDGGCVSHRCTNCSGRGYVASEGGEA